MSSIIDGPLYAEQVGTSGRPIVFIHSNPTDHVIWLYQMAHLSFWYRAIAIDLPGYGRSPRARPGLTMVDIAEACWQAVDQVTDEPAILAGVSVGYSVVMHMANLRPKRTLALVLSGCSYLPVKSYVPKRIEQFQTLGVDFRQQYFLALLGPQFRDNPLANYFTDILAERNGLADVPTIVALFQALEGPDPDWLFEGITMPTLIVTGTADASHQAAFALQERIAGCELASIEDAGHNCNLEMPWKWDELVLDFLTRHGLHTELAR